MTRPTSESIGRNDSQHATCTYHDQHAQIILIHGEDHSRRQTHKETPQIGILLLKIDCEQICQSGTADPVPDED
jgi:hypothetical protein